MDITANVLAIIPHRAVAQMLINTVLKKFLCNSNILLAVFGVNSSSLLLNNTFVIHVIACNESMCRLIGLFLLHYLGECVRWDGQCLWYYLPVELRKVFPCSFVHVNNRVACAIDAYFLADAKISQKKNVVMWCCQWYMYSLTLLLWLRLWWVQCITGIWLFHVFTVTYTFTIAIIIITYVVLSCWLNC